MSNFCPSCGAPHDPSAHFCEACGARLGAEEQTTQPIEAPPQAVPPPATAPPAATQPYPGQSPGGGSGVAPLAIAALVVGVVAIIGIAVVALFFLRQNNTNTAGGGTITPTPSPSPTPTVTRTREPRPTPTVTVTRTAIPDLPDWPTYTMPDTYKECDIGVFANPQTSCPFAANVASAWYASGGSSYLPSVYSPATGRYYDMYCSETLPTECTGGNNASVVIDYIP